MTNLKKLTKDQLLAHAEELERRLAEATEQNVRAEDKLRSLRHLHAEKHGRLLRTQENVRRLMYTMEKAILEDQ